MRVSWKDGRVTAHPQPYWDFGVQAHKKSEISSNGASSPGEQLRLLLEQAVARHLVADVPVGVFLSSGIDSTSLVALAARSEMARGQGGLHTVSVIFPEQEYSEAELARQTAQRFGSTHREVLLRGEDMLARLEEAVSALDQPSMDGINTYFVSWGARQAGLKVALSGLGGDEIFGGYGTFRRTPRAERLAAVGRRVPASLRTLTAATLDATRGTQARGDARRKLLALWREPDALPHPYFFTRLLFTPQQVSQLLNGGRIRPRTSFIPDPWRDWLIDTAKSAAELDSFTAVSCLEARSYMVNTLLRDTDAMSMAHSLEVRVPFLDHRIVEAVTRMPEGAKRNGRTPKPLLVRALQDLLPPEVVRQRKRTFTLPWESWFRGALREQVANEFSTLAPALEHALQPLAVKRVWSDFLERRTSWSRVWSLFVLNRWAKLHLQAN